jgi:hypothetical protein
MLSRLGSAVVVVAVLVTPWAMAQERSFGNSAGWLGDPRSCSPQNIELWAEGFLRISYSLLRTKGYAKTMGDIKSWTDVQRQPADRARWRFHQEGCGRTGN